jgi:hypothetical protein
MCVTFWTILKAKMIVARFSRLLSCVSEANWEPLFEAPTIGLIAKGKPGGLQERQ